MLAIFCYVTNELKKIPPTSHKKVHLRHVMICRTRRYCGRSTCFLQLMNNTACKKFRALGAPNWCCAQSVHGHQNLVLTSNAAASTGASETVYVLI